MRVCLVYDCLFPHTVGGAERWYRNLAERLAADGHQVTYLTLRQWDRGAPPDLPGVDLRAVGPRMRLYARPGRRRVLPPLVFGLGVFWHLLRHGRRYDVVHTASFPYFSLLAAALARPVGPKRLIVDWHEFWTKDYWQEYLGRFGGAVGWLIQRRCAKIAQHAFCFSALHADRLREAGGQAVTHLSGQYAGPAEASPREPSSAPAAAPLVVFAGRLIPEKRATLGVEAVAAAIRRVPNLRAVFFGEGPERAQLIEAIDRHGLRGIAEAPGFVSSERVEADLGRALCMLMPSRREGYGMAVVEAAACGTPSIVVAGADNASAELIEDGVNGVVVARPEAELIADAIVEIVRAGDGLRQRTARWFEANALRLSLETSLQSVLTAYAAPAATDWRLEDRRLLTARGFR